MKSGPTLKGCTLYFLLSAAITPRATVVFPTPLQVPAISTAGVLVMVYHRLIYDIRPYKLHCNLNIGKGNKLDAAYSEFLNFLQKTASQLECSCYVSQSRCA